MPQSSTPAPAACFIEPMKRTSAIVTAVAFLYFLMCPVLGVYPAGNQISPKTVDDLLTAITKLSTARDFAAVRATCSNLMTIPGAPAQFRSYAQLRIAQSYLAETNLAAAKSTYEAISTNSAYPEVHRYEARECIQEIDRLARGLPARDVTASRTKIPQISTFAVEYFVSPQGSDANPGTHAQPFATLEKARDTVRALKMRGPLPGPVCVHVLPGTYPVQKNFTLTAGDSGTEAAPIVYRADEKGRAVLYGGARVNGFVPVTDSAVLNRLPAESRGHVFQSDLRKLGITSDSPLVERGFGLNPAASTLEVFFNGAPMTLARWPNTGFVNGGKIIQPGSKRLNQPSVFEYLDPRPARWTNAEDAWLFGYFHYGWADRTLKIFKIDPVTKQITCAPYNFDNEGMEPIKYFNHGRIKYFAFNLLEELDQPGEWYLNRKTGILYIYPPSDPTNAMVEIGMLSAPMVVLHGVSQVRLEGLVFDLSRTDGLRLDNCTNCLLAGCTIKRFAGSGISIAGGHGDGILGCDLCNLGRSATEVAGGDRPTLTPAGHFVENCLMHSFGRLDHTYVPGILMEGVGIRAAHNYFYDCPSTAIRFDGNDLLMEYNKFERVVLESEDQGAIETWGNPTFRGNVLRYNSFADIGPATSMEGPAGRAGIRLDDAISGTVIYGNIFYRASQSFGAVQINSGRDNIIDNNIFAECETGISGGYYANNGAWKGIGKNPEFIFSTLYKQRYPELAHVREQPGLNFVWRNVFWKCGSLISETKTFSFLPNASYPSENPGFVHPENGDFRLEPDAEAIQRLGLRPIPIEEIGLYPDPYRASPPP